LLAWLLTGTSDFNSLFLYISIIWSVILAMHYLVAYEILKTNKKRQL
jgi:hypothetical protein